MTENGNNMVMPVAPYGGFGNGGFGGGWGSDIWIILLVLLAFGGFGFGGWGMGGMMGGFGGFGGMYEFPWLLASNANNQNATQSSFDNLATNNAINALSGAVTNGFSDVQLGIAGVNQNICQTGNAVINALNGGFASAEVAANARQMAAMQQAFASQTAMSQGLNGVQSQVAQAGFDNRYAIAGIGSDIAREACATRTADAQNTQAILVALNNGIQSIKDDLCQDRLDAERRENANLRSELMYARGQAASVAQTAEIRAGQVEAVGALVNELRSCPIPAQPVAGNTPLFSCNPSFNGNGGCGCGGNNFYN